MVTAEGRDEIAEVKRRGFYEICSIGTPRMVMAGLRAAHALVRRAVRAGKHPLGWSLHEELLVLLMRETLSARDLGTWRTMFSIAGGLYPLGEQVRTAVPELSDGRTFWIELPPALQPIAPRGSVVIVSIHGGGFIAGSNLQYVATFDKWMKTLAARGIASKVLSVHYPLAPEHPYPAGRLAVEEAIEWLAQKSGITDPIILMGDSAGANLSLGALARLRDAGRLPPAARPRALLLISPAVDISPASFLMRNCPGPRPVGWEERCRAGSSSGSGDGGSSSMGGSSRQGSCGGISVSSGDGGSDGEWDEGEASPPGASGGSSSGRGSAMSRASSLSDSQQQELSDAMAGGPPLAAYSSYWYDYDFLPHQHAVEGVLRYYISEEQTWHPYASPGRLSSFSGLVHDEMMVVAGGAELMAPDIRSFAAKLKGAEAAGDAPRVTYLEAPGQVHTWPMLMLHGLDRVEEPLWQFFQRHAAPEKA